MVVAAIAFDVVMIEFIELIRLVFVVLLCECVANDEL